MNSGVAGDGPRHRYVFVAGLHRTGTSLLASIVGSHPDVATIEGANVPENEGSYLQGAIPHTAKHGVPGEYAIDPDQYLTESSALNTLETVLRLEREWGAWFDPAKPWRLEKSPVNLTRMRLLQGLFPRSQFLVVTRHPLAMAHALQKWSDRPVADLAGYGVRAYRQMLDDAAYLHAVMIIRYEDLVRSPARHARAIEAFLDLGEGIEWPELREGNREYELTEDAGAIAALGYGPRGDVEPFRPVVRHYLRDRRNDILKQL